MNSLHATLTLNNRAVELFHSNYIPEAAKTYYESLCMVRQLLVRSSSEAGLNSSPLVNADVNASASNDTPPRRERFHSFTQPSNNDQIIAKGDKLFFYQSTLTLHESSASGSQNAMSIYCAGILFNAAILHHQDSIKSGNSRSMDRAYQLYQSSLQILMGLSSATNDTVALLLVANNNNLAHIELEKGLVVEAGERLLFLSHLFRTSSQPMIGRIFSVDEFEGILTNTLSGAGMVSSPAA